MSRNKTIRFSFKQKVTFIYDVKAKLSCLLRCWFVRDLRNSTATQRPFKLSQNHNQDS